MLLPIDLLPALHSSKTFWRKIFQEENKTNLHLMFVALLKFDFVNQEVTCHQ